MNSLPLTAPGTAGGSHHWRHQDLDQRLAEAHTPGTGRCHHPPLAGPEGYLLEGPGGGLLQGAKRVSGLPPITSTLRLRPPRSPRLASPLVPPPWAPLPDSSAYFPFHPAPPAHSLLRPKTDPWARAHLQAPGPRPLGPRPWPWLLREFRAPPTPAGAQLRAWGSYPAVGGPHRHLPPGPRHLRTRPRLPAAARGLGAAPLLPCSAVRIRLSGTGARRVRGPRLLYWPLTHP